VNDGDENKNYNNTNETSNDDDSDVDDNNVDDDSEDSEDSDDSDDSHNSDEVDYNSVDSDNFNNNNYNYNYNNKNKNKNKKIDTNSDEDNNDGNDSENSKVNTLSKYAQLVLIKYAGTHELYLVINKQDDNNDQIEIFRQNFIDCQSIMKCENIGEFRVEFDEITLHFRADNFEQCDKIVVTLREFLEQYCFNNKIETPPPPEIPVTDSMAIFFGA